MLDILIRLWRHRWLDELDTHRVLPSDAAARLRQRVADSEARHNGQVRICVEAGLPTSYLWRHLRRRTPIRRIVRERAVMMFSKLGVWNTEHNNGVLIYLLLAERAIELVADRGLARETPPQLWREALERLGESLRAGRFEEGLTQALGEVSALLVERFPRDPTAPIPNVNELPDEPVLL